MRFIIPFGEWGCFWHDTERAPAELIGAEHLGLGLDTCHAERLEALVAGLPGVGVPSPTHDVLGHGAPNSERYGGRVTVSSDA